MKIRLHSDDCAKYGVPDVIDFDDTAIGLRELAAIQRVTGYGSEEFGKATTAGAPDAIAALLWIAIGRAVGKRPDWDTFDVRADGLELEGEPEPEGKDDSSRATTSAGKSEPGRRRSPSTTASSPGSSTPT